MDSLGRVWLIYQDKLIGRYVAVGNNLVAVFLSVAILGSFLWLLKKKMSYSMLALGLWLSIGILGLSVYRFDIYDHYLGFMNPVIYLIMGAIAAYFTRNWQKILILCFVLLLSYLNLSINPLLTPPQNQLLKTQEIAKFVIREANGQPFNFALIAKSNYDPAYQFYLDYYGYKPKMIPFEVTDQLFVVCEDEVCEPIGHSKYEISGFGWAEIASEKAVWGVKIFKLVAYSGLRT